MTCKFPEQPRVPCTTCPDASSIQEVPKGLIAAKLTTILNENFEIVQCLADLCGGGSGPGGPETITTLVDNGDGTFTYNNEAGAAVTVTKDTITTFVDNGDGTYTYTNENGVITNVDTSCAFTIEAGTTGVVGNADLGTSDIECGDTIHFWSPDDSVTFAVLPGSAIVGIQLNLNVAASLTGDGSSANPLQVEPSTDAGNSLIIGTDGKIYVPERISQVAQTVTVGNQIAAHTDGLGVVTNILETVTTLTDNGDNTVTYTSEDGTTLTFTQDSIDNTVTAGSIGNPAPAGIKFGIDPLTASAYYVDGAGNWQAVPVSTIDLNTTPVSVAGNYGGGGAVNPPTAPDDGDVHIEVYDDSIVYFIAAGGGLPVVPAAVFTVTPTSMTLTADRGVDQVLSNGDTLLITGGEGLSTVVSGPDTVTVNHDFPSLTDPADTDFAADELLYYDVSTRSYHTINPQDLQDGEVSYQSNVGNNVPAAPVDPTVIATPIAGDAVIQQYDDGLVFSTYDGTTWTNTPIGAYVGLPLPDAHGCLECVGGSLEFRDMSYPSTTQMTIPSGGVSVVVTDGNITAPAVTADVGTTFTLDVTGLNTAAATWTITQTVSATVAGQVVTQTCSIDIEPCV